jgi:hypothetical protein
MGLWLTTSPARDITLVAWLITNDKSAGRWQYQALLPV